ncbi:MAG: tetratricopeptide repeat protein, partial [Eudoraea sp.]|nr:tetratricopeptide repeat protein [Eudoraea sp.]
MNNRLLLFPFVLLFSVLVSGQNSQKIDSLQKVLLNQKDSTRLNTLYQLFTENVRFNIQSSKPYMDSLLREAMDGRFPKYLALAYKAEGLYHYYASDFHQAEKSYEKSISIYNELDLNIPLSRMYNNQGIVLKYLGKLQKSKEHHLNSLKLKEELQLPPSDIAASLVNLGVLENELGNGELSTDYYLRAEEICIDNNLIRGLNLVRGNLAGNFKDAKKYDLALKYYKLVYDYHEENNDYRNIARITNSMGSLYFSLDSLQKAKSYYLEANELNKKHAIEQMRGLTTRNLGKIAMKEKSYNEALSYFLEANKISQTTGTNTRNVGDYLNISEAYAALGDYKNAYANRRIHFTKYDSVFQKEKIEQINELEIKYQTEKKEAEIALQEEEINTLNEKAKVDKLTKGLYAGGMASALA